MSRKRAILSESKKTSATTAQVSTNSDARPQRPAKERLSPSILEELWSIWRADPRVPSVKSRRSWAISRDVNSRLVDGWFLRRRTYAKKAGQPLSDDSYDLPLEPSLVPKQEESVSLIKLEPEPTPDLSSDDMLVYPPDIDHLDDVEASSDTIFDDHALVESKRPETPAYKEVPQQPGPECRDCQLEPSSANLYAAEGRCDKDTSLPKSLSEPLPACNQGRRKPSESSYTCVLCKSGLTQDPIQSNADAMSDSKWDAPNPYPRLDFSAATLSELSAIPFLFCTPSAVPPDNVVYHQSADPWTIVEDELAHLVNDGKLDFSFLDVPHLASMELID